MKKLAYIVGAILLVSLPLSQIHKPTQAAVQKDDYPTVWKEQTRSSLKDSWRMGNRECTSWVAWKTYQTYHYQVTAWEDAKDWPTYAKSRALTVDEIPEIHSAAVDTSYRPGHVMWVEKLNEDGTIHVSQYNADNQGNYSEADRGLSGLVFIHFRN
jgi:surface antigen